MPVIKHEEIKLEDVTMNGVFNATKANVIGPAQGWSDNTMRVFRIGPHGYTPQHQHDWEHVNYVIRGQGTLTIGDQTYQLTVA